MEPLDVSNILGLTALGAIMVNLVFGLAIWSRLRIPMPKWIPLLKAHKITAYSASALIILHVVLIPFIHDSGFRWKDLLLPLWTKHQPWIHTLGALALYLFAVVVISSYLRSKINHKVWRRLHYLSYIAIPILLVHGIFTDPAIKDRSIDFLDAEKLYVEACAFIFALFLFYRLRVMKSRKKPEKNIANLVIAIFVGMVTVVSVRPGSALSNSGCCRFDPDLGLVVGSSDSRFITWGYSQWALGNGVDPYFRRVRQGSELDFPTMGKIKTLAVYELDFTDNDFFRLNPKWKIWENAFIALQNAQDPARFRVLYGENTHILSSEDNLPSGNLPTVNRSAILESHGSIHAFGTQWGGQVQSQLNPHLQLMFSAGDNRGSLNQDDPRFSPVNDLAAKANWGPWQSSKTSVLSLGTAVDWTRKAETGNFILASSLANIPVLSIPVQGTKTSLEMDGALMFGSKVPMRISWEWISSFFSASDTRAQGGYLQVLAQIYGDKNRGDLSTFLRPEWAMLNGTSSPHAEQTILRGGLNWNIPYSAQLVNILVENAWHLTSGDASLIIDKDPGYEFRLMLRASLTRHNRF